MMKERAERLKQRLIEARAHYDTDARMAAAIGGVKPGTLNKWLRSDPAVWPESHLQAICDYFGETLDQLTAPPVSYASDRRSSLRLVTAELCSNYKVIPQEDVVNAIDTWPMAEQLSLAQRILSKAQAAIAC